MASKVISARAPAVIFALLLAMVLSSAVASARPLKSSSSSWLSEGEHEHTAVASPVVGDIQTVVGGAAERDGAGGGRDGRAFMSIEMLGGIKDSGPSPGVGH